MSLYRKVNILYSLSVIIFTYILWILLCYTILGINYNIELISINIVSVYIMQYLILKGKDRVASFAVPIVISIVLSMLYLKSSYITIVGSIYTVFILYLTYNENITNNNYEYYKDNAKKSIIILLFIGLILMFLNKNFVMSILKLYITFLVFMVITLRESRRLQSGIQLKNSAIKNLLLLAFTLILLTNKFFLFMVKIIMYAKTILDNILTKIIDIILVIFAEPITSIVVFMKNAMKNINLNNVQPISKHNKNLNITHININNQTSGYVIYIVTFLKIVVIVIVLASIYNAIAKKINSGLANSEILQEKEKIKNTKINKNPKLKNVIKNIFNRDISIKGRIVYIYRRFQIITFKKQIFKSYMTARELSTVTKVYTNKTQEVEKLTGLYNEAKFSNHTLQINKYDEAKDSFQQIKKSLE